MVLTLRCEHRLVGGVGELAFELELQPLGRQLDRRQRVLDLVREPARHLAPRRRALRRHDLGDVVEHHQPRSPGSSAPRTSSVSSWPLSPTLRSNWSCHSTRSPASGWQVQLEALFDRLREGGQQRESSRRERVLDLVREPARHLAPRRRALRRHHLGDVVEHHQARVAGQQRAAHEQRQLVALVAHLAGRTGPATARARRPRGWPGAARSAVRRPARRRPAAGCPPACGPGRRTAARAGCASRRG